MALDVITWAPEVQLCFALLLFLWYGTGPVVSSVSEAWMIPALRGKKQSRQTSPYGPYKETRAPVKALNFLPVAGPGSVLMHLSWWAVVWCLLGALLVWFSPFLSLQTGGVFLRDNFTIALSTILYSYAAVCLLIAIHWCLVARVIHREYVLLILLTILGRHLFIMRTDLMAVYLCLELQSFALVVLCSLNYTSAYAVEAGMKYFLLSAFSSCLLLLGIGLIYWQTGLTRCAHLAELLAASSAQTGFSTNLTSLLGVWLVSLGLLWKLAAAPLHFWAADVYQGAWSSVSLLISTLPKISVLAFWIHTWHTLWTACFGNALAFFSAASLIVGAIAPLAQVQLKRLMAFRSIGHMGFMLMPLASESVSSVLIYLALYLISSRAIWGLLMWPYGRSNQTASGAQYIWDLASSYYSNPAAAAAWTVSILSLAGLPPAAGFLGKYGVFWSSLNAHQYALVCLGLAATLLASVYYLRVLKVIYVDNPKTWGSFRAEKNWPVRAYLIALSSLALAILLWHGTPLVLASHLLRLYNSIKI